MSSLLTKALREIGDVGRGALYEIALPQATLGGTWSLTVNGVTSAPLARLASWEQVRNALESVPAIGTGNVDVWGATGGPFRIQLKGVLGAQRMDAALFAFSADGAALDPPAQLAVVPLDYGAAPVLASVGAEIEAEYSGIAHERLRFLSVKRDLLQIARGEAQKGVDEASGDRREDLSQQFKHLSRLYNDVLAEIQSLTLSAGSGGVGSPQSGVPQLAVIRKRTPNGLPYGALSESSGLSTQDRRFF